jgi:salicylate hydroxylase
MTRTCDVAIAGGGIAGLTLATSLLRQSISVEVFEQDADLREIGAGIAIGGNATRLLRRLDVDPEREANVPPALECRRWSDGHLVWSCPIGDWYLEQVGAPFLTLHRATLQRLLAAAVPRERIHLDHRLTGLADEPGGVRLRFENGEDCVARLVAGVDGVHSTVRPYVCGAVSPVYSGEIGFRGVIPIERSRDLPNPTALHAWCGPRTHAIFYGIDRGTLVNLLLVYLPERLPEWTMSSNRVPATVDEALATFAGYGWDDRMLDLVRNIEGDMNFWALLELPRQRRWSRGRVVILGDAAHAPLPHQGQGAGQAIEDAYALGALLGRHGVDGYSAAFEEFATLRQRRAWRVQTYSRLAGRAFKLVGDAATRRDETWPSLPDTIGWIHRYREEEDLVPA